MYCAVCHNKMEEMLYYYDNDWGHQGSKIFDKNRNEKGNLMFCPNCGSIRVKIIENLE
jgi:Zn finger protein HypA/HybF involved in hydrogenase expression